MGYVSTATTTLKYGTPQVETATVVVPTTVTTAGNFLVKVTGAGITGSPVTVTVAVALGDVATQVAQKTVDAIKLNSAISSIYTPSIGGTGTSVILTRLIPSSNDATLNVELGATGTTSVGITASATSTHTTAGINLAKLCDITGYPDMGSAPSKLDTTDLTQGVYKTSILGLQDSPDLTFECNYDETTFNTINLLPTSSIYGFQLDFGTVDGKFNWLGQARIFAKGGGVDEVRKMTVVLSAMTPIAFSLT